MIIKKLEHTNIKTAQNIQQVFQKSYAIEAALLNAVNFPPLKRPLKNYLHCKNDFFGYFNGKELHGVIEIKHHNFFTHIQSLVVHPTFFRKGIAQELMVFILNRFDKKPFMVETGVKNIPAINLYKKFQFREIKQWDTDYGVKKIRFERS